MSASLFPALCAPSASGSGRYRSAVPVPGPSLVACGLRFAGDAWSGLFAAIPHQIGGPAVAAVLGPAAGRARAGGGLR